MTSFGGPGGPRIVQKPIPPERGSFPLDHDGECKHIMSAYLRCIRQQRGVNAPECRAFSKEYLNCRMQNDLMAHDEFKNLGFAENGPSAVPKVPVPPPANASPPSGPAMTSTVRRPEAQPSTASREKTLAKPTTDSEKG